MAEEGVACNVHYKPLPMMTAYNNMGFDIKDYPDAYKQFENEVTLPLHTSLTNEDVDYVIEKYIKIVRGVCTLILKKWEQLPPELQLEEVRPY